MSDEYDDILTPEGPIDPTPPDAPAFREWKQAKIGNLANNQINNYAVQQFIIGSDKKGGMYYSQYGEDVLNILDAFYKSVCKEQKAVEEDIESPRFDPFSKHDEVISFIDSVTTEALSIATNNKFGEQCDAISAKINAYSQEAS